MKTATEAANKADPIAIAAIKMAMEEQEKEQERKKENAKKAAEYIRRLRDGTIPEFEVHFTFSNSGKKRGSNLL